MPFLQPSIEGEPLPTQDPWDWNVDQVVFALTNNDSLLLKANSGLALPDLALFAINLRRNDVNGLALLTEVTGDSVRDELGFRLMSHRASINYLVRLLKKQSQKYGEHFGFSGRESSSGDGSHFTTLYPGSPQRHVQRAVTRISGPWQTPMMFGDSLQTGAGIDGVLTSVPDRTVENPYEIDAERPHLPRAQQMELLLNDYPHSNNNSEGSVIDSNKEGQDGSRVSKAEDCLHATTSDGRATPDIKSEEKTDAAYSEQSKRHGETTIIDGTGRKRRRLVLGQMDTSQTTKSHDTRMVPQEELASSPSTCQRILDEVYNTNANALPILEGSLDEESEHLTDTLDFNVHGQLEPPRPIPLEGVPEPGAVIVDEQGRKRMRPILLSKNTSSQQEPQEKDSTTENPSDRVRSTLPSFPGLEASDEPRQRLYGKKAYRRPHQVYLGLEPLSIDSIFYGEVSLEKNLDEDPQPLATLSQSDQPNDLYDFIILSRDISGNGQRLYVHSRMKYFLQSRPISFKRDGQKHVGVIPYPDRIGKKHYPLSITIFSKSSGGITASRSNRSRWIKDTATPDAVESKDNVFNVADPALAQNESDDPEWKALEKWKYMEGKDDVLPVYGESGSEGEYELDTWNEIEQERGELARPLGRSKSKKMTGAEVDEAIDEALKQITHNWLVKRQPNLERKAWRLWMKSRRDGNARAQIGLLALKNEELETRISTQKKKIAKEIWSKSAQVAKQCTIMQPSIFDREDNCWKISILKSRKRPAKPPPAPEQVRVVRMQKSMDVLQDGEENLDSGVEYSESSDDGSLDGFVVEDATDAEINEALLRDDDLDLSDTEDGVDSGSLAGTLEGEPTIVQAAAEYGHVMADAQDTSNSDSLMGSKIHSLKEEKMPPSTTYLQKDTTSATHGTTTLSSNFIDLTQHSDPIEPQTPLKAEASSGIKTPPVFDSENDSEVFQRSRTRKPPVFRVPSAALETVDVINLDSDSAESMRAQSPLAAKTLPAFTDVGVIRKMDPSELVERQDRKRLLIWMIAHAPSSRRKAAFDYVMDVPVEQSYKHVISALKDLRNHKQRMRGLDKEISDNIMQVATWYVCWTIPVKVDLSGLRSSDIATTIADEDGYEPFYDFLLECMDHYQSDRAVAGLTTPQKQREKAVRVDSDEALEVNPIRKRRNQVSESQATLEKRQAARERLIADEERRKMEEDRRRKQLKYRFAHMGSDDADSMGVVVNPGKLENQEFVYLSPRFGNGMRLKPHQKAGLQFMWREITADHEDLQGCLLAQTMGLGKTMQVIALLVALSEAAQSSSENIRNQVPPSLLESRSLVLCPPALVENWWDEFILWVPHPSSEIIGTVRKVNSSLKLSERLAQIYAWHDIGGVLLIGYDTFKNLINNKATKTRAAPLNENEHMRVKRALLEGPNLAVADEAHQFKSKSTGLNLAMNQIKTKSRIALTGSPLNNNLLEYYTLIDWISPGYLGTITEFKATYEEIIREGLYQDSTASQKRESLKRLKALELEMEPKIHRADVLVLHNGLQGKSEFVIRVPLTELQEKAYKIYVEGMRAAIRGGEPCVATWWSWLGVLQLLCNHPKCYLEKLLNLKAESANPSKRKAPQPKKATVPVSEVEALLGSDEDAPPMEESVSQQVLSDITVETERLFEELAEPNDAVSLSNKMQILMSILSFAETLHDKVLVFSHRIPTLDYIANRLAVEGKPYARIDGLQNPNRRQQITKDFNEGSVNVCLISTRAGGTGLNLFGANRVVILDDHFNPMWEQQAIGRAYRFGQQKSVFVYRLTAAGTFEQALQNQAIFKEHLATRVVDKKNPTRNALKGAGEYLFPPKRVEQEDLSRYGPKDPSILGRLLADQKRHVQANVRFRYACYC
jgi:SNF2 family DNA or RNA helicase